MWGPFKVAFTQDWSLLQPSEAMSNPGEGTEGRAVVYSNTNMGALVSPTVRDKCGFPLTSSITPKTPNQRGDSSPSVSPTINRMACLTMGI